jgi:cytochrome c oxidase cbb3-type subunit III
MHNTPRLLASLCTLAALVGAMTTLAAQNQAQDHAGQYPMADIVYGAQLYAAQCVNCHGANGDGVGGVNLRSGPIRRAATDRELQVLITTGLPGTGMPAFTFNSAEQIGIVAYVRNMNAMDTGRVRLGDAARGRAIVEGKGGCLKCHAINDTGSVVAPDLSDIGATRAPSMLERHLTDPSAQMMPINRPVRAVMKNGKTVSGRRVNEDTFSVQLMDDQGRLVSLLKSDVRDLQIGTNSPMPSFKGTLNGDELSDVIAYLLSLKGL